VRAPVATNARKSCATDDDDYDDRVEVYLDRSRFHRAKLESSAVLIA
jgi:hypothetical protein